MTTTEALRSVALEHGWSYREQDAAFADRWCGAPFTTWLPHRALDVVTGVHRDVPVVAFRWVASTKGVRTGYLVVAAALRGPLPRVSLVPLSDAVDAEPFGELYEPEDSMLAEQYQIAAVDVGATAALLHLDAVDRLRRYRAVDWRIEGSDLLCVQHDDSRFDAGQVWETVDLVASLAVGIPGEVFAEHKPLPGYPAPAEG